LIYPEIVVQWQSVYVAKNCHKHKSDKAIKNNSIIKPYEQRKNNYQRGEGP
jgi:hypothetical protein